MATTALSFFICKVNFYIAVVVGVKIFYLKFVGERDVRAAHSPGTALIHHSLLLLRRRVNLALMYVAMTSSL